MRKQSVAAAAVVCALLSTVVPAQAAPVVRGLEITPPSDVTATVTSATSRSVTLSWSAPASDGGSPVSDYLVRYRSLGSAAWTVFNDGVSTSLTATITGLTPMTSYQFQVGAVNAAGLGISSVKSFSPGSLASCIVRETGRVSCWGISTTGSLGTGIVPQPLPVEVPGITNAVAIQMAGVTACALLSDGTVSCWGWGIAAGQGTTDQVLSPKAVPNLSGVVQLAAGGGSVCALLSDATLRCWGTNGYGQQADGTKVDRLSPHEIAGLTGIKQVVGTGFGYVVVHQNGRVSSWGNNTWASVGDGTLDHRLTPYEIPGISDAVAASGGYTPCILRATRQLVCWGRNDYNELGDAVAPKQTTPVAVWPNVSDVVSHTSNVYGLCALRDDRSAWCSGLFGSYDFGQGAGLLKSAVPLKIPYTADVVQIYGESAVHCARLVTDAIECWGDYYNYELANGLREKPTAIVQSFPPANLAGHTTAADPVRVPGAVSMLKAVNVTARTLKVTWVAAQANGGAVRYQYRLWVVGARKPTVWKSVPLGAGKLVTTLTISKLVKGKKYAIELRASNSAGFGAVSQLRAVSVRK